MIAPTPGPAAPRHRRHRSELSLIGSLLLALLSAALINLGFVLQQRGHDRALSQGRTGLMSAFRQPPWLLGQAVGWIGFAGQIVAVALAPLTLVQAFSAGSLALSVPLAARLFGHRVARWQLVPIALMAVSLASLPLGFGSAHGHLQPGLLIAPALLVMLIGGMLAPRGGAVVLAMTAGAFYGVADGAIKAASIGLRFHGTGILTGWVLLAGLFTFGGFLAFQAALRDGDAVRPLSLMNAFTALAATALGIAAFGEPLGSTPATAILHVAAIIVVLACVRPLAGAQQRLVGSATEARAAPQRRSRLGWDATVSPGRVARALTASLFGAAALLVSSLTAFGLLYELRQLGLFAVGPRVTDSLPLLQLAGFDAQPISRVLAATLLAGLVLGLALIRLDRRRRAVLVGAFALLLMLTGSDASYALARNLPLAQVLLNRTPGLGSWLEAVLLTAASAVPGPVTTNRLRALAPSVAHPRALVRILVGALGAVVLFALLVPSGKAGTRMSARSPAPIAPSGTHVSGSPARAPSVASATHRRQVALTDALDAALQATAARIHAPAATAAVVACGRVVWAGATGVLDLRSRHPANNGSLFVLNSSAKIFVATMIVQEIQDHDLSLSTRLSEFFPELPNAARITVRMLLNMTSGLPDYLGNPRIEWMIRHRPRHRWTVDQVLTGLGTGIGAPAFPPGQRYQYSDTNYIILGAILERITHSSIERDFQQLIARPLGITSATFVPTPTAEARLAHPYWLSRDGSLTSKWIPGFGVATALWGPVFTDGGLAASSLDLARFANALLGGRLLSTAAVSEMTHLGLGHYGFGMRGRSFGGQFWLGQAGVFGGFAAEDWSEPSRQLTIADATNLDMAGTEVTSHRIWKAIEQAYDRLNAGTDRQNVGSSGCSSPAVADAPMTAAA